MATGAGPAAGCIVAGAVTVPWAIQALPLSVKTGTPTAGAAALTAGVAGGASAHAALGAAPHKLTNIIAAAVTAPRKLENGINPALKAVSACAGRDR